MPRSLETLPLFPAPKQRPVSPSQISTFTECQRKWAWRAIAKITLPPHKSAALGTATHTQLEKYLDGTGSIDWTTPQGQIAQSAIDAGLLPVPNAPGMELEKHFTYTSKGGYDYLGYIDVLAADSKVFPGIYAPLAPAVSDHKTTSNLAYAKTPTDLVTDPQAVIYAMVALDHFKADAVDLIWTYMLTRGPRKAKRTHLRVFRPDVEREFSKIEITTAKIVATHNSVTDVLSLPPSTGHCGAYGGCPYRANCTDLSVLNPTGKPMSPDTANMLNELTARLPANEQPPASDTKLPDWMTSLVDPLKAPQVIVPPANTGTSASTDILDSLLGSGAQQVSQTPVPADMSLTMAPPVALINPPGEAQDPSAALLPRPDATEKKTRVRRTKAQMAADEAAKVAATQTVLPRADDIVEQKEVPTIPAPVPAQMGLPCVSVTTSGYTLYVNCFPIGGAAVRAESLFDAVSKRLQAEGVEDYRLVEFGKGSGMFAGLVNDILDNGWNSDIVVDSRTPEGAIALSGLSQRASRVVRGFQ